MSSNSIRISAQLFENARTQGDVLSRSTAQQVEHWARLGAALEAAGLSVHEMVSLLHGGQAMRVAESAPGDDAWAPKRRQQARDLKAQQAGQARHADMSWFAEGKARSAKLKNSPY